MPLVSAKCTNCGANLNVDNTKDAWICDYCHSAFIVEKAIHNYNVTNNNNIRANVVNIYGGNSADFVIRAGSLIEYTGVSTDVVIPNSVRHIDGSAFCSSTGITSVTIPNSVTSIGLGAFSNCRNLTSITIPNSVTSIEACAFTGSSGLTSITIPSRVTSIGQKTFEGCSSLRSITIPNSVTSIGEFAFNKCSSLTSITIPNSVTSIGLGAFDCCSSLVDVNTPIFRVDIFRDTPYHRRRLMSEGKCRYCGGEFKGVFKKTCSRCARQKDY